MKALDDWLSYIEGLHPKAWDLGLDRVNQVAEELGLKEHTALVFTVAGTNGKGSTCEFIEQFCLEVGYSVGKSTSPHLLRFNERIQINGKSVSDQDIVSAFETIETSRGNISLTYFEFSVLASVLIFARGNVDVWVLEVGLGGRLDAMNIFDRDVSVVTQIALDHQAWLGSTRELIALEKAAILRSNIPCVVADLDPPSSFKQYASRVGSQMYYIGDDFNYENNTIDIQGRVISEVPVSHLPKSSAVAALQAVSSLGMEISDSQIFDVISRTRLMGRLQWCDTTPRVLCDVAHNPAATIYLRDYVKNYLLSSESKPRVHALVGMYSDKEMSKVIQLMSEIVHQWYFTDMDDSRAANAEELQSVLDDRSHVVTCDNIQSALREARKDLAIDDLLVVYGSFPVVAGVLGSLSKFHLEE